MEKAYKRIIEMSVRSSEYPPEWMQKPFLYDGKIMATNASILIMFPAELAPEITDKTEVDISAVIPKGRELILEISNTRFMTVIDTIPLVPEEVECEECDGDGSVDWFFQGKTDTWESTFECPKCNGNRKYFTGEKVHNPKHVIKIGKSIFTNKKIAMLSEFANVLNTDTINLINQEGEFKGSLFEIGKVEILMMPLNIALDLDDDVDNYTIIENY